MISNKSLSSGQIQKISFIRSILGNIDLLVLDESTANLDKETKEIIFNNLSNLNISVINSTHDISELKNYDYKIEIKNIDDKKRISYQLIVCRFLILNLQYFVSQNYFLLYFYSSQ